MAVDIAALQYLYGADFTTRAGNTVYTWSPTTGQSFVDGAVALTPGGNRILMTVWDGGGIDTYDLSNYTTDLAVNLTPGKYSALSTAQLADLDQTLATGLARGNVFNALQYRGDKRSLIEHATGGSGDDKMIGNAIGNTLRGGAGDDIIHGGAGRDTLQGQAGTDQLLGGSHADTLIGGTGGDVFDFNLVTDSGGSEIDWIRRGDSAAAFEGRGAPGGDVLDVSGIDANELVDGNQSFVFGTAIGIGRLYVREIGNSTLICGNVDGDVGADFVVLIEDGAVAPGAYTTDDLLL
jgi:serralysin